MKKQFLAGVAFAGVAFNALIASPSMATDLPQFKEPPPSPPLFSWTGFYVGITAGAAWGSFDPRTSTFGDSYMPPADAAAVTSAGTQSINPLGFATGGEAGYNWQTGPFLIGFETDLQALHLTGAANSGAVGYPSAPGSQFVVSSYADSNWLFTARPRIGFVAPNNWLLYATGGLAVAQLNSDFLFTDNVSHVEEAGKIDTTKVGFVVGGGIEAPLTDRLSLKAEYLYAHFGTTVASVTANSLATAYPGQIFSHSGDLSANIVRVGLNYRFAGLGAGPGGAFAPIAPPLIGTLPVFLSSWEIEVGARVGFTSGKIGAPQPLLNNPNILASRLQYNDLNGYTGEVFARVDHSSGVFVKGFLGAGGITSGNMNDEDFPAGIAYSNTLQSNNSGNIGYATIDLGYSFLTAPGAKVGAFVGYSYYDQNINTYGCTQVAGSNICQPPGSFASNFLGIAEDDHLNALRLGLSAQFMLTDRLRFTADAAYVPLVSFNGQDDHNARELLLPEAASSGDGVMLEGILGYDITDAWNVGVGARYWAWNTRTGTETFDFLGSPPPQAVEPARFTTERYGVFLQTSYRWGAEKTPEGGIIKGPIEPRAPANWTGFYVGGFVGGGWSNDQWSDPFGSAPSGFGGINVAGFGDIIHATGPLGGGQIGFNWQQGSWVFGVEADGSGADLRGENTCFSGLGGVDCQRVVKALGTYTGRVGFAWDRSLAYVKAGGAWANTSYSLNANTNALALGTGSTNVNEAGWTVGGGVEYALTKNWSTMVEYDHIGMGSTTVPFPTVAVINGQNIAVRQNIDIFKLGVNYKFDFGGSAPVVAKY
ncbi:MAG: outer membrane beta-barrel protein [Methylovirgula sp.]